MKEIEIGIKRRMLALGLNVEALEKLNISDKQALELIEGCESLVTQYHVKRMLDEAMHEYRERQRN